MSRNWLSWMDWIIRRQARHTMPHQRYGGTSPTISRVMCGPWAAYFMKWLPCVLHFRLRTWMSSLRKWQKDPIKRCPQSIRLNWQAWSKLCSLWIPDIGQAFCRFYLCHACRAVSKRSSPRTLMDWLSGHLWSTIQLFQIRKARVGAHSRRKLSKRGKAVRTHAPCFKPFETPRIWRH